MPPMTGEATDHHAASRSGISVVGWAATRAAAADADLALHHGANDRAEAGLLGPAQQRATHRERPALGELDVDEVRRTEPDDPLEVVGPIAGTRRP